MVPVINTNGLGTNQNASITASSKTSFNVLYSERRNVSKIVRIVHAFTWPESGIQRSSIYAAPYFNALVTPNQQLYDLCASDSPLKPTTEQNLYEKVKNC